MAKILRVKKVKSTPGYTSKKHVRKGDSVMVIAGDHKGTISKVVKVIGGVFVMLSDVSVVKSRKNKEGKFEDVRLFSKIHISNVKNYDSVAGVASRLGFKMEDGKKVKFFKKTGNSFPKFSKPVKEKKEEDVHSKADSINEEAKELITNSDKENDTD